MFPHFIFTRETDFANNLYRDLQILYFPYPMNNRGLPFTHIQVNGLALRYVRGASFKTTDGVCAIDSTSTAHKSFCATTV